MGILRITVRMDSHAQSFRFTKDLLIFGDGPASDIDVLLHDQGLKPEHVKIQRLGDKYTAFNMANDPFVTLNGFPFGKKNLKEGDILHIRGAEIVIEAFSDDGRITSNSSTDDDKPKTIVLKPEPAESAQKTPTAFDDLSTTLEIESFLKDVQEEPEMVFHPPTPIYVPPLKADPSPKETFGKLSLKDDPFHDNEEEARSPPPSIKQQSPSWYEKWHWKFFAWGLSILAVVAGLIASEMYLRLTTISKIEEMHASEGVADIAMGLTYAQLHEVDPASQNWSDPEFLRHNLLRILSPTSISQGSIMSTSQTSHTPYILRIYTSYDLSRFIIVAQPTPNLLQMWVPKHAIIVDSNLMQLQKTMDFKALNRFLAYPNPLDESHSSEWDQILTNSTLIPLADLAEDTKNQEFLPPKALGFLRPGAENKIYNAPRYNEFGAAVLLHALARKDLPVNWDDDDDEEDGLERLAAFENLILYIPEKLYLSPKSADLLSTLPLEGKFLLGYLNTWPDGRIKSSHLLMQNSRVWNNKAPEERNNQDVAEAIDTANEENQVAKTPLDEELENLAKTRKEDLQGIKSKILVELDRHVNENDPDALKQANDLLDTYELLAVKFNLMIKDSLNSLRSKYSEVSYETFHQSVSKAGLAPFLEHSEEANSHFE